MSVPPSEYRRQALQRIADRAPGPAPDVPVDLQLPPMPQEGGAVSTTGYEARPNAAITSDHTGLAFGGGSPRGRASIGGGGRRPRPRCGAER
jgi:hypothetical protein